MSITFKGADNLSVPINYVKMYSDSTPMVKTDQWDEIVTAETITVRGGAMANFVTAMFLVDAVTASGGSIHTLVLPYIPGARQDRVNPTGDVLFTAKSVAEMINARGFDRVVVLDPHSPVSSNLIKRVVEFPLAKVSHKFPHSFDGIIAADKGGQARAEAIANDMSLPIYYGGKSRDVETGKLTGFTLDPIPKRGHYLVADDICDGGGTFLGLAEKVHARKSTADLYVSHGIFSKGTEALKKSYETIFTTDSLAGSERNDVTVLAVVEEMENYNG